MEGLTPVYQIAGAVYKSGQQIPDVDALASGYRLPTEAEWEWAARGGVLSNGYEFSGGNLTQAPNYVWYEGNSGDPRSLKEIGIKLPNELGIHDMSGNAFEWCWDFFNPTTSTRQIRGGSFISMLDFCAVDIPSEAVPSNRNLPIGFRVVRKPGN
jgi:formylglycine-generating enzyme required for sulfatase activity